MKKVIPLLSRKSRKLSAMRRVVLLMFTTAILFIVGSLNIIHSAGPEKSAGPGVTPFTGPLTLTVNTLGDAADTNVGDGLCDTDAGTAGGQCTLRAALQETNAVSSADTISFSLPANSAVILNSALPDIAGNLTIGGPGASLLTIQRSSAGGTQSFRVFTIDPGTTVTISGVTISNGDAIGGIFPENGGGGILNDQGTLTINDSIVRSNHSGLHGGGISNRGGVVTINRSSITGNTAAGSGGGVFNTSAEYISFPTLTIDRSTISNNTAGDDGGGIFGGTTITNTTISSNSARFGGGLANLESMTLSNVTIAGNNATNAGGGVENLSPGTLTFSNTIIAANTSPSAPDCYGTNFSSNDYNLIGNITGGTITGTTTHNISGVDPVLGPLQNNGGSTMTRALLPGSPAIDAGNSSQTTDQRGQPRPIDDPNVTNAAGGNGSDIGSFESRNLLVNSIADTNDGVCDVLGTGTGNKDCTLREAINRANSDVNPELITFASALTAGGPATITLLSTLPAFFSDTGITGPGANLLTVQRNNAVGAPNFRVFTISSGRTVSISNLTVSHGHTDDGDPSAPSGSLLAQGVAGGGILNAGTLTLTNLRVTGNSTGNGAAGAATAISFAGQGGNGGGIFNSGTLTLTDVTVTGNSTGNGGLGLTGSSHYGGAGGDGAGIFSPGPLTMTRVTVSNNTAGNGNSGGTGGGGGSGGGVAHSGLLTMTDCTVSGNMTGQGGVGSNAGASSGGSGGGGGVLGVFYPSGTLVMKNSVVSGNRTANGASSGSGSSGGTGAGVLINYNGTGTIINSTITDNHTGDGLTPIAQGGFGGGIYNGGTLDVIGTTISGNDTGASSDVGGSLGGGVENDSTLMMTNCTVSGNHTGGIGGSGGGIVNNRTLTLINVTVTGNTSFANAGHGISQASSLATPPHIRNSIIAGNGQGLPGSDISGDCNSGGYNLIGNADNSTGFNAAGDKTGSGISPLDALLGALANNGGPTKTQALLPGSPAINAGSNANLPADSFDVDGDGNTAEPIPFDQRGLTRTTDTTVDIGAFESGGFNIAATGGTPQSATITTAFASPLMATVSSAFGEPVAGGVVTFTAPASGASGTFAGGGTSVTVTANSSGVATSPTFTANRTAGSYVVTANTNGISSAATFGLANAKGATTTSVGSSVNPSNVGQNITFTTTVFASAPSPTGTVQFVDNGTNLGSPVDCGPGPITICIAQLSTSSLSLGTHTITADYSGDANFASSAGTLSGGQVVGSIIKFSSATYSVNESGGFVTIAVNRSGGTSGAVTVDYATDDTGAPTSCANTTSGLASSRCDYTTALGTLRFAATETQKTFVVLITQDSYTEGPEMFTVRLSNLTGAAVLATPSNAMVTINDSASPTPNAIDDAAAFVRMHYHDFLNREPDAAGLNFWANQIASCGGDPQCIEIKRINVSAAFFLSIEFQETGYLVERLYKTAYGDADQTSTFGGSHQFKAPIIRVNEFLPDTQEIGLGVVVGQTGWETVLENNKRAFTAEFVQRARFTSAFPPSMTPAQFVDTLNTNAGNPLSPTERNQLVADLTATTKTRAEVLRAVAEDPDLFAAESNRAFVLMQFFGYLRRNPSDAPDTDYTGYDFWLTKLNQFNGNFVNAEMVKAFITSSEYRQRFGP